MVHYTTFLVHWGFRVHGCESLAAYHRQNVLLGELFHRSWPGIPGLLLKRVVHASGVVSEFFS